MSVAQPVCDVRRDLCLKNSPMILIIVMLIMNVMISVKMCSFCTKRS